MQQTAAGHSQAQSVSTAPLVAILLHLFLHVFPAPNWLSLLLSPSASGLPGNPIPLFLSIPSSLSAPAYLP